MTSGTSRARLLVALVAALLLATAAAWLPAAAFASGPVPHVPTTRDTDVCAMCHRAHTAMGDAGYRSLTPTSAFGNALLISPTGSEGDAAFCYTCHGVDAIGADTDIQTPFTLSSRHVLGPSTSAYGPSPKQCSDCHDSHGNARTAAGTPFPALLRSYSPTQGTFYAGEEYCANCHPDRAQDRWDGLAVYKLTKHYSAMATPTSGTGIRCSACHAPHGSDVAPLIAKTLAPPNAPATVTVLANDRTLCFGCHPGSYATYPGGTEYQTSTHALSSKVVSVTGEWASAEATRAVGECQVCHAPMGRSDGSGGVIPKLAEKPGPDLCLTCHTTGSVASTDLAGLSYPATVAAYPELLASWSPPTSTAAYGRISAYSQAAQTPPRPLFGPREYSFDSTRVIGQMAAGDINGDGRTEVLVGEPGTARIAVFSPDPLRGLSLSSGSGISLPAGDSVDMLAVADIVDDVSGLPEVAVVDRAAGSLYLFRYSAGSFGLVDGPLAVGAGASSLACGDVTGTASADIVVTSGTDDTMRIFTESAGALASSGPFGTHPGPTGISVGDARAGGTKDEIVVVNSGDRTISIFNGSGTDLIDYLTSGDATPLASAIADVLPGESPTDTTSGKEVVVALASATSTGFIDVYPQDSSGLTAPQVYATGPRYNSGSVTAGDVDGDERLEVIVGNAGRWAVDGDRQLASIQVMHADPAGTALDTGSTWMLSAGGVELAGSAPSLLVTDVGLVGPSRHPWDVSSGSHVSTEQAPFERHVECVDCHDVHEATSTVAAAPDVYGSIKGSTGVSVTNVSDSLVTLSYVGSVRYEYELCFKCHSAWADPLAGRRDLASEFNTRNASVHAVEGVSSSAGANAGTFESGWGNDSVLYCKDCHSQAQTGVAKGPHLSPDSPILGKPYLGVSPADSDSLCFECHKYRVFYTGQDDSGGSASFFSNSGVKLHELHGATSGFSCAACHLSHGSTTLPTLLSPSLGYTHSATGGTCSAGCHAGAAETYDR